ncbi:DUF1330 domain-containing protein [Sphingomonas sp.]|uniref:DUF1330 domain-containing protein n=1 Tax=Sphingomonas sp. TaxID=28214 RepID=UPI002DD651DD|nr:DUF1330 domain-containing protein [Sphingomonas sp.]
MPAYAVFIRENTRDEAEMEQYLAKSKGSAQPFGVKPLAFYGRMRSLEGAAPEAVVVVEFPTFEDAEAWYESDAYREARKHRHLGADYRALIVEGLPSRKPD